jgi:hypothetical protein
VFSIAFDTGQGVIRDVVVNSWLEVIWNFISRFWPGRYDCLWNTCSTSTGSFQWWKFVEQWNRSNLMQKVTIQGIRCETRDWDLRTGVSHALLNHRIINLTIQWCRSAKDSFTLRIANFYSFHFVQPGFGSRSKTTQILPRDLNFEATSGTAESRHSYRSTSVFIPHLTSTVIGMMENPTAKRTMGHCFILHSWFLLGGQDDATWHRNDPTLQQMTIRVPRYINCLSSEMSRPESISREIRKVKLMCLLPNGT